MTDRKLQALKRKLQARGKTLLRPTRGVRVASFPRLMIAFSAEFSKKIDESPKQSGRTPTEEIEFRVQRDWDRELIATVNTRRRKEQAR